MGIDVSHLIINPNTFDNNTTTPAIVTYHGLVGADGDNPVTVTIILPDPTSPVYFLDEEGAAVKSLRFQKTFKVGLSDTYTRQVIVRVKPSNDSPTPCEIDLTAKTTDNSDSTTISSLYYQ